jgi:hypothetical protein
MLGLIDHYVKIDPPKMFLFDWFYDVLAALGTEYTALLQLNNNLFSPFVERFISQECENIIPRFG